MPERFSLSKYLRFVSRADEWAVYHSLFGNLSLLDVAGREFLNAFSGSATIAEASRKVSGHSRRTLQSYANDLLIRGFLTPTGCDEYAVVEENRRMRRDRLHSGYLVRALQLVTIKRCNYRCKYCFMDFQTARRDPSTRTSELMSAEIAEVTMHKLIDLLRRNGNDCLNVEFFGGEPLMNWPLIRHVLTRFGNKPDGHVQILYSITTNGALITQEMAALFRAYGVTVTVSVDIPERINGLHAMTAKSGDRIQRPLTILKEYGNTVTFNSVISQETLQHVDGRRLIDFANEYNVGMVGLILDLSLAFYRSAGNRERALEILLDTYRYGRETGVRVVGYWHQIFSQIIGEQSTNLRSGYKTCPATGCKVSVEPNGSMFTCECTAGEIGHIKDLDRVLASEAYADYAMHAYRHAPECAGCEIEGFCSGVCMGSFENEYKRRDLVEPGACEVFRQITRDLIADMPGQEVHTLRLEGYSPW